MIAEREKVFQLNNHIIKSFKLPRFAHVRAVTRILPPEIVLTIMFVFIALFFTWASNHFMRWAASTETLGPHMLPDEEWSQAVNS